MSRARIQLTVTPRIRPLAALRPMMETLGALVQPEKPRLRQRRRGAPVTSYLVDCDLGHGTRLSSPPINKPLVTDALRRLVTRPVNLGPLAHSPRDWDSAVDALVLGAGFSERRQAGHVPGRRVRDGRR
jgi:hypothetical protein